MADMSARGVKKFLLGAICTVHPLRAYICPSLRPPQGGRTIAIMPADVAHPGLNGPGQVPRCAGPPVIKGVAVPSHPTGEGRSNL